MIPIEPKREMHLLPEGTESVRYAEDQPQYVTLPTLRTPDGKVVSQWQLDPNEVELLKHGVPVTLVLHMFGMPLQPIQLMVGGADLRA